MAYNRTQARALCTAAEYELFEASLADHIRSHDASRLKQKIRRARTLRDKYRDLLRRQRLELRRRTGSKKGSGTTTNQRTEGKARLFAQALERFQRRADDLDRAARAQALAEARKRAQTAAKAKAKATAKAKSKRPKRRSKGAAAAAKGGFASQTAERSNRQQRLQKTRGKAVQGHVRASGRRRQARRDARR